jgi:MFS family permease
MVAYTLSYVDRTILSLLVGPIKADLDLSDTGFSLLHGFAFACLYTVLGIPFGAWADRANRRNLIAGGVAAWSAMTAACGLAGSFASLFVARVGVGIGEATLGPAAYSAIADSFPPERRGRALGVYSTGVYVGAGLAILLGGLVVAAVTVTPTVTLPGLGTWRAWQVAFFAVGAPGLLVAALMLTVGEPPRRNVAPASPPFSEVLAFMSARRRFFVGHFVGVGLLTLLFNGIATWVPAYLSRTFGDTPRSIATSFGPLLLVFGTLGILAGGACSDWLRARGRTDAELRAVLGSAIAVWPFASLATLAPTRDLALTLLAPLFFFSSFAFGAAVAALQIVTPGRLRGRVSALYLLVVNLTGIGLGGTATALLTDRLFRSESAVGASMALLGAISAPAAALMLAYALPAYRRAQSAA